jgi:hypothetical protein
LLVADLAGSLELQEDQFYLVAEANGAVALADGVKAAGQQVLASVLFLARPPQRESVAAQATELLSV